MATLPQLIDIFAQHDGRDHATLMQFGRVIREAGLLPRGKSGAGAPQMTARDAATLLLGIYGSNSPKDAPATLARLASLTPMGTGGDEDEDDTLRPFRAVEEQETFLDAMTEMLIATPSILIMIAQHIKGLRPGLSEDSLQILLNSAVNGSGLVNIRVTLQALSARISVSSPAGAVFWDMTFAVDDALFMGGFYGGANKADRKVEITFGFRTISALWGALAKDALNLSNDAGTAGNE